MMKNDANIVSVLSMAMQMRQMINCGTLMLKDHLYGLTLTVRLYGLGTKPITKNKMLTTFQCKLTLDKLNIGHLSEINLYHVKLS